MEVQDIEASCVVSSNLLQLDSNWDGQLDPNFDLRMADFVAPPSPKRLRLSLTNKCFNKLISSPERLKAARGVVPVNTETSTHWAVKNFNDWASNRNTLNPEDAVPPDLLKSHDADLVCKWMCHFIMETLKCDGSLYLPSTLRSLVSGLICVLQVNNAPFLF